MRKHQSITLRVGTSYVSSTSINRPSDGKLEDVNGGVHVPVVEHSAFWAYPFTHGKRKDGHRVPAGGAHLGRGFEATALQELRTIPLALVFEHSYKGMPAAIIDRSCEFMVSKYPRNTKALNRDDLVLVNDSPGELVLEVFALCADALLNAGYLTALALVPIGADFLAGEPSLLASEFLVGFVKVFRISDLFTIRESAEVLNTDIDSNAAFWLWMLRRGLDAIINHKADVVCSRWLLADGHFLDCAVHFTVQLELDVTDFGEVNAVAFNLHASKGRGFTRRPFGFESREGSLALEKSLESHAAIRDGFPDDPIGDIVKPRVALLLEYEELVEVERRERLARFGIVLVALLNRPVIRPPCAAERTLKRLLLGGCRVEPIFVRFKHIQIIAH